MRGWQETAEERMVKAVREESRRVWGRKQERAAKANAAPAYKRVWTDKMRHSKQKEEEDKEDGNSSKLEYSIRRTTPNSRENRAGHRHPVLSAFCVPLLRTEYFHSSPLDAAVARRSFAALRTRRRGGAQICSFDTGSQPGRAAPGKT